MAVCWERSQSRKKLGRAFEGLHTASGHVGTYRRFHLLVEALGRFRIVLPGGLVCPKIEFSLVYADGSVRENHFAADCKTTGVIGMDVRDQNVCDVLGLHAGGAQTIRQLGKLRSQQVARARVHKNCVAW
jgi:hypothetical protein